jgi:hypothetical protein
MALTPVVLSLLVGVVVAAGASSLVITISGRVDPAPERVHLHGLAGPPGMIVPIDVRDVSAAGPWAGTRDVSPMEESAIERLVRLSDRAVRVSPALASFTTFNVSRGALTTATSTITTPHFWRRSGESEE